MGIKLKEGKTYELNSASTNPSANTKHGNYYANIKEYSYSAKQKILSFVVEIFGDEANAPKNVKDAQALDGFGINVKPDKFDEVVGSRGITIPELYALALADPKFADWENTSDVE